MLFKINRFHALALLTWQFGIFFASQMLFPIFRTPLNDINLMTNSWHRVNLSLICSNYVPKWRCSSSESFSKNCTAYELCRDTVQFEYEYFHSSAIEYGWICGSSAYFAALYGQIQFGGVLFGTILWGSLSDCFGRKPICIVVLVLGITFQILSGLAPTWQLLLASRFFIGLSIGGTIVVVCTFVMEMILPQQRMALRAFFNWGTARLIITGICYFFPDWRSASIVCALVASPMILIIIFVFPESVTWLHSKGRLQQMQESEKKMARVAGVKYEEKDPEPIIRQKTILDLLRDGILLRRVAVLWCMWFTVATCGYAIDLNSSNISGHLFLNQVLFSILIMASKVVLVTYDSYRPGFSRRNLHQYSQLAVIVCFLVLISLVIIDEHSIWILVVNLIGTIFIEYVWDACYLCAVESVPTNARATSLGTCSFVARCGAICAPLLTYLSHFWAPTAYLTVVLLGIVSLCVSYAWLVETKNVNLDKVKLELNSEEETKMMPQTDHEAETATEPKKKDSALDAAGLKPSE